MTQLARHEIRPIGIYGVIRPAEVDDALIPDGAVTSALNIHFDRKGAATVRPGMTRMGSSVTTTDVYECMGLHNSQSSTAMAVFTGGGSSSIYTFDGSAWAVSLTGGTSGIAIRFIDFASYTIAINFIANTLSSMYVFPTRVESGSYWASTHSYINPQNMWGYNPRFGEVFKSKIYLSGDTKYPSRLFFSSVISSAGKITWNPSTDYVDINPGDGEDNTALKRFSLELLFFKPNYIYRFRTSGVDPDPLIKIGTRSNESVVEGKRGIYFHHDTGFYRYSTTGSYPEEISRAISDIVKSIPFAQFSKVSGWKADDQIYWSIGDVTVAETDGNTTWKNVVLRYTESADIWTIYSYGQEITRGGPLITGTSGSIMVGTHNGVVAEFNKGQLDLGEPIKYMIITKKYELEGIENEKVIEEIVTLFEKAKEAHLFCRLDDEGWKEVKGAMTKTVNHIYGLSLTHHEIQFKITGISSGEPMIFRGIIITKGENNGLIRIKNG